MRALWQNVATVGAAMMTDTGPYAWGDDDNDMRDAADDDLLAWADDVEARLGADVGDFRAALLAFIAYRSDGAGLDSATYAGVLAEVYDIVRADADAARAVRERVDREERHASAVNARDRNATHGETMAAWADALDVVGGDA